MPGMSGRRDTIIGGGLAGAALAAWTAVAIVDAANLPEHIWACTLTAAAVLTAGTINWTIVRRIDRVEARVDAAYLAMTRHVTRRPGEAPMTPDPWPALRAVQRANGHTQHGRHASR